MIFNCDKFEILLMVMPKFQVFEDVTARRLLKKFRCLETKQSLKLFRLSLAHDLGNVNLRNVGTNLPVEIA